VGQVYWNLEGADTRVLLPIRRGPIEAEIPIPSSDMDFATITWLARVNEKGPKKSSGQGFRNQGVRLAVLAAQLIVEGNPQHPHSLDGTVLEHAPAKDGSRISGIT